jgi:hypothetical protein
MANLRHIVGGERPVWAWEDEEGEAAAVGGEG